MFVNDPIDKFLLLIKGDDWKVMRKLMESTLSLDKIKQVRLEKNKLKFFN